MYALMLVLCGYQEHMMTSLS